MRGPSPDNAQQACASACEPGGHTGANAPNAYAHTPGVAHAFDPREASP